MSQFIEGDRWDLDMDIDPIEQWAGNSAHVTNQIWQISKSLCCLGCDVSSKCSDEGTKAGHF